MDGACKCATKKLNCDDGINNHIPEPNLGLGTSVVNLSSEKLNKDEISILSKGLSFIPAPQNVNKSTITESIKAFERRIKLDYFFSDNDIDHREKLPFTHKSTWNPPDAKISNKVHNILADLNNKIENVSVTKDQSNISFGQINALKTLKNKKHLVIKKADKGPSCVIMDKTNYILEAERQLNNESFYKRIEEPIYPETSKKYKVILNSMMKKDIITPKQANYLMPKENPRPRRFYLLPKIHKDMSKWTIKNKMPPGRPIVSDCSSESYQISEFIDYHLQDISKSHQSYIKDTADFLDKIRELEIPQNALLITMDIESLYTNIQTKDGIASVKKMFNKYPKHELIRPDEHLIRLLELSLNCNDFIFNNQWYLQLSGTAMGKRFAPAYANIDMAIFEEEVLKITPKKPLAYFRFLDDIFLIWQHSLDDFKQFFDIINNYRESIKFQYNISETSVDFLDVTVFKGNKFKHHQTLDTKVYFKPTDTHELLHKSSFHPKHTFDGIIKSQVFRFWRICSDSDSFDEACEKLFKALRSKRHYSRRFLRQIKHNTVQMLTTYRSKVSPVGVGFGCGKRRCECCLYIKPASDFGSKYCDSEFTITGRLTCNSQNIVYLIECKKCEEQYVGETSKTLRARLTDHISNINCYKDTSVAQHFNQFDHNGVTDMQITPIIQLPDYESKVKNSLARRKEESFFIKKLKTMSPNGINEKVEDFGTLALPIIYNNTSSQVTKLVRQAYIELQEQYPRHFKNKLVTAYKRNPNLSDLLVCSKLK